MAGLIGALRVSLSADTAQFSSGMRRARREASTSATAIQRSLGGVKTAITGIVAGLSVGLFTRAIRQSLDYAGSLGEVSQQLGVTTRDLQVLRFAAGQVGISQEELDKSLLKLTVTLGQVAAGAEAPRKALEAIGVSADQLKGKDTGESLRIIADGLEKIPDRAQRAAVEVALFGRTGAKLDTLLAGGRRSIDELAKAAERLGIVLSDEQIQRADDTADKLDALKTVLQARIAGVVADNAGAILSLANALANLTNSLVQFLGSNPEKALALIGAMGGAMAGGRFGTPGAIVGGALGGAGGFIGGSRLAQGRDDSNTDIAFRRQQLEKVRKELVARQQATKSNSLISFRRGSGKGGTVAMAAAEVQRQLALLQQAMTAHSAGGGAPMAPGADVGDFLGRSGGGKKDNSAAEAERARKEALRRAHDFESEQRQNQMAILGAQEELAVDGAERATLQKQMLDIEREQERAELALSVSLGERTQAEADTLNQQLDNLDALKRRQLLEEERLRALEEVARLDQLDLQLQQDALRADAALAETMAERREIELRLLDLAIQEERARIALLKASKDWADQEEARRREVALNAGIPAARESVMRDTAGPIEAFLRGLPDTAAKANEALENVAANGMQSLIDGLTDAAMGVKSLGDVFKNVANQIIAELIRIQIQKALVGAMGNAAGGGGQGGGFGGSIGTIFTSLAGLFGGGGGTMSTPNVVGMATGGSFTVLGNRGYDTNLLSLNGKPIANVSYGERVSVANDNGGRRGITFDLRGAVLTEHLLTQMNQIAADGDARVLAAAPGFTAQQMAKSQRRRLG